MNWKGSELGLVLSAALVAGACGDGRGSASSDGGAPLDASTVFDAAMFDGARPVDASTPFDAVPVDAGSLPDAGGPGFHFSYPGGLTPDVTAVERFIVNYDLIAPGAMTTPPLDQNSVAGVLYSLAIELDYVAQEVTAFTIEVGNGLGPGLGGFRINASLLDRIPLSGASTVSFSVTGLASDEDSGCTAGCLSDSVTGTVELGISGPQGEAIVGSFEIAADTLDLQLSGDFLVEIRQSSTAAPPGSAALSAMMLNAATDSFIAGLLTGSGKDTISLSGSLASVGLITHDNGAGILTENAVVHGICSSEQTNLDRLTASDIDCVGCLSFGLIPEPTDLSDAMKHVGTSYTAYWGRWSDHSVSYTQGTAQAYNAADLFYAYSENLTPDTSAAAIGATTVSYSKILGANPIDQDGVSGTLGAVTDDVNYGSQQNTGFNLDLVTADGDWDVHLPFVTGTTIQEPVALNGAINAFAVEGIITAAGTSSQYDAYGDVSIIILGPNADAILGAYNLSVVDTLGAPQDAEAIGVFLLERNP